MGRRDAGHLSDHGFREFLYTVREPRVFDRQIVMVSTLRCGDASPCPREGGDPQKPVGRALRVGIAILAGEAPRMSERFFDYWRIDVFTDTPLTGNPLAVFPRATGLSPAEMLGIAREMNISETTFIFPSSNPSANYRNRIFTPGGEIAFAGHPSIGTAFVAAQEGLVPHPDGASVIYQELEIGVLPLELICEGGQVRKVI